MKMSDLRLTPSVVVEVGNLSADQLQRVKQCRGSHNRLGFCYQLIFVKVMNYFPAQKPLEIINEILLFSSLQISIDMVPICGYENRRKTIAEHQEQIRTFLKLKRYDEEAIKLLSHFLFEESLRYEQLGIGLSVHFYIILPRTIN